MNEREMPERARLGHVAAACLVLAILTACNFRDGTEVAYAPPAPAKQENGTVVPETARTTAPDQQLAQASPELPSPVVPEGGSAAIAGEETTVSGFDPRTSDGLQPRQDRN